MNKMELMSNIKNYEHYLFDKYRNNDITLRVRGRMKFTDLTEKECLNYLKYNVKTP